MKILISAAEASSDAHAAQVLKALKNLRPEVQAIGIGGVHLREQGMDTVVSNTDLSVMGTTEILGRIPKFLSALNQVEEVARKEKPAFALLIDYPDFHFQLAKRLNKLGIPCFYFIPPKVWVWRKGRIQKIKKLFKKVFCIFPFEEEVYQSADVPVKYVGNPLFDELPHSMSKLEARKKLNVESDLVVTLMPGSRPAELQRHFVPMLDAVKKIHQQKNTPMDVLVPLASQSDYDQYKKELDRWSGHNPQIRFHMNVGQSHLCLLAADVGVIKSGTSTLEAAALGCPHVVVYRASWLSGVLFRHFIGYRGPIALSNILAGQKENKAEYPFQELIMEDVNADRIFKETIRLVDDPTSIARADEAIAQVQKTIFKTKQHPSENIAQELLQFVDSPTVSSVEVTSTDWLTGLTNLAGSFLWSSVNALARKMIRWGWIKRNRLDARVISVGNIQVGGAGKTPLVRKIAQEATARGLSTCILTRGYKGKWERAGGVISPQSSTPPSAEDAGDEAVLLHELVPQAWIGVGANRRRQYERVVKAAGKPMDIVILDDGFQHWAIERDVDLVAVTSQRPRDLIHRDFLKATQKADLLVWTKGKRIPRRLASRNVPLIKIDFQLPEAKDRSRLWLVTGVADGVSVKELALNHGYQIERHLSFPDHARFLKSTVDQICLDAKNAQVKIALTGKDWVKWRELVPAHFKDTIMVLEPNLSFNEGEKIWTDKLWDSSTSSS